MTLIAKHYLWLILLALVTQTGCDFIRSPGGPHNSPPNTITSAGVTGRLIRFSQIDSKFVAPRAVDVWFPPDYDQNTAAQYPVVYMHDGQNLMDPAVANGGNEWGVDETMTRLISAGTIRPAIIVAIWNTKSRFNEYMPQKAAALEDPAAPNATPPALRDKIVSDNYLKFIVTELKPLIDRIYRTSPGRESTFVMGSSMGALISAYAVAEYPEVFGGAGCLSTHWVAGNGAVIEYLKTRLPDPATHLFYFDHGTETVDAQYGPYQEKMDAIMRTAGYTADKNWITRTYPGADHSPISWAKRIDVPLTFFLHK
jgi:predicted alpha/beta superfamily hydrolase